MAETGPHDQLLVQRFQAGDLSAGETLYRRYRGEVQALVWRMVRGAPETEDLVHDIFVRALRGLAKFRSQSSFRTWLYHIATNTVLNHLERSERAPFAGSLDEPIADSDSTSRGELHPSRDPGPDEVVSRRELADAIQQAIDQLAPPMKAALVLRDVQGLSYEEIADALELNLGTVKSRIARARVQVQERLRAYV